MKCLSTRVPEPQPWQLQPTTTLPRAPASPPLRHLCWCSVAISGRNPSQDVIHLQTTITHLRAKIPPDRLNSQKYCRDCSFLGWNLDGLEEKSEQKTMNGGYRMWESRLARSAPACTEVWTQYACTQSHVNSLISWIQASQSVLHWWWQGREVQQDRLKKLTSRPSKSSIPSGLPHTTYIQWKILVIKLHLSDRAKFNRDFPRYWAFSWKQTTFERCYPSTAFVIPIWPSSLWEVLLTPQHLVIHWR